jgi:transposase
VLDREDTPAASVDLTQIVRIDGPGTKYAAAENRARITQQTGDRMWTLKHEGYSDKDICKIIEDEFGVVYQPKSIGGKLKAIGKKKNEEEERRLDEELSDWHVGEVSSPARNYRLC